MFCSALSVFEAKCRRCTTNCTLVQMSLFGLYLVSHLCKACSLTRNYFSFQLMILWSADLCITLKLHINDRKLFYGLRSLYNVQSLFQFTVIVQNVM